MNDPDTRDRPTADGSPSAPANAGESTLLKMVVIVLAAIGGIALLIAVAMGVMHFSMMGGMGSCYLGASNTIHLIAT